LWLRNRDRNEQAGSLTMFDLIGDWKASTTMDRMTDDTERTAE